MATPPDDEEKRRQREIDDPLEWHRRAYPSPSWPPGIWPAPASAAVPQPIPDAGTVRATGPEVIRLADEERDIPEDLARIVAEGELEIHRGDLTIRQSAANQVLRIFAITNITVLGFLFLLFAADVWLVVIGSEPATARIIDRGVVKTLIGATVVQVGTIMFAMARYLFPRTDRQGLFFQRTERPGLFARLFGRT